MATENFDILNKRYEQNLEDEQRRKEDEEFLAEMDETGLLPADEKEEG